MQLADSDKKVAAAAEGNRNPADPGRGSINIDMIIAFAPPTNAERLSDAAATARLLLRYAPYFHDKEKWFGHPEREREEKKLNDLYPKFLAAVVVA